MTENLKKKIRVLEAQNRKLTIHLDTASKRLRGLEEDNLFLRIQMESSPDGILIVNQENKLHSCNRVFLSMWGIPGEVAKAGSCGKILEPILDKLIKPDDFYEQIPCPQNPSDEPTRDELELKDGRVIERYTCLLRDPGDEDLGKICFFRDITQRKMMDLETETALRKSEELYRHLFEYHPMPLMIFDPETMRILKVNDAAATHYGYEKEEFEGLTVLDIRPREDVEIARKTIRSMNSEVERLGVFRHMKKDGTVILVDIHSHEITFMGRPARLVLCLDVTERHGARQALEESEEKFRTAFITSPDSICINRLEDGLYVDINEGFEKNTGYSREEIIGRTDFEFNIWADPEDRATLVEKLRENGQVNNMETLFRMKDGSVRYGLMSAKMISLGGETYILTITRDISERKKDQEQIRSSLKEKVILLREIHHRVKNNLQVVSGLLNLQASFIEDPEIRERFRESENRVKAIAIMHEDLYQSEDLVGIDFSVHVRKLVENLISSYGESSRKIDHEMDLESAQLLLDTAIPCSLIITELVSNALKHAFKDRIGGILRIVFHPLKSDTFFLQVSDNGKGFPEEIDMTSVKSMGLQLVKLLVEQLGGTIEVSREGGTTFKITFREYQEAGTEMY